MSEPPKIKLSAGLRLFASPPERDARGRLLDSGQAKLSQRARMAAAEDARIAASAAMLGPPRKPPASAQGPGHTPADVTLDQRGTIRRGGSRK